MCKKLGALFSSSFSPLWATVCLPGQCCLSSLVFCVLYAHWPNLLFHSCLSAVGHPSSSSALWLSQSVCLDKANCVNYGGNCVCSMCASRKKGNSSSIPAHKRESHTVLLVRSKDIGWFTDTHTHCLATVRGQTETGCCWKWVLKLAPKCFVGGGRRKRERESKREWKC